MEEFFSLNHSDDNNWLFLPNCMSIAWDADESFCALTEKVVFLKILLGLDLQSSKRTSSLCLTFQELSKEGQISQHDYVNRFWFFTVFRISFLYKWVKALSGALVGQPIEEIDHSGFERKFEYALYGIRTITRKHYIEKLVMVRLSLYVFQLVKKEYDSAKKLASEDPDYDMDLIHKRQWCDKRNELTEELVDILVTFLSFESSFQKEVCDKPWVVNECLKCNSNQLAIQQHLIELAESIELQVDEALRKKIQKAKIIYDALPRDTPNADLFLRFRASSLLQMVCAIAKVAFLKRINFF